MLMMLGCSVCTSVKYRGAPADDPFRQNLYGREQLMLMMRGCRVIMLGFGQTFWRASS